MNKYLQKIQHALRLAGKHILMIPFGAVSLMLAPIARICPKKVDVGIGPEPLINQKGHKLALLHAGYSAETFVTHSFYYTTHADYIARKGFLWRCLLAWRCLFRYRILYFYFKGGPFAWCGLLKLEPWIYKISGTKTMVTGYGGDCQDFYLCDNLPFKHGVNMDYPHVTRKNYRVRQRVDRWTLHADYILSGCDWVYYTPRWDALCPAHFTVDTNELQPMPGINPETDNKLIILHAPNHKTIKGSETVIRAVKELAEEGLPVELDFVQKVSNAELYDHIRRAHIVVDQLVIGWYGMFAVEAMSAGKPVLCYLDHNLIELYEFAGIMENGELPLIQCKLYNFKEKLRNLVENRKKITETGILSRAYAVKHHSIEATAKVFAKANSSLGILPSTR